MRLDHDLTLGANRPPQVPADEVDCSLRVLKFGGSVLRSAHDLPRVAGEIYRHVREGSRVIAVVSAFEGETDQLLAQCGLAGGGVACSGIPDVVSLGEEKSAQFLRLACDRIGLTAAVVKPEVLGILTDGDPLEGAPLRLSGDIAAHAEAYDVLIVPGFVGLDATGRRTLLGRGGTDFSAIFIAGETGAALRLYKDVDGVYDHDPAADPNDLARFERVSWQQCLTIARPLLQPRAVEYASRKKLAIEVGAIGSANPTVVAAASREPRKVTARLPLRIGLAGFGTIGQAVQRRLASEPDFEIAAILVRDLGKSRPSAPACALTDDLDAFFARQFDVLIDATCNAKGGKEVSIRQLATMQDVVSANKAAIAGNLRDLTNLAAHWDGRLRYSACVGGGAPMLETVRRARKRALITEMTGVLNGTVNFILDETSRGASFESALVRAREAGFAEADPWADLDGQDAAAKLRILAVEAWGEAGLAIPIAVDPLDPATAARIAASAMRWLQVSSLRRSGGAVRLVPAQEASGVLPMPGEWNFLSVRLETGQVLTAQGRGAGGGATAEAIMADLFDVAQREVR